MDGEVKWKLMMGVEGDDNMVMEVGSGGSGLVMDDGVKVEMTMW